MNLTKAARITKKAMIFTVIAITVGLSSWIGYTYYYYNIYLPSLPKPEVKPDVKFGILPQQKFDNTSVSSSNFSYSLDTPTGEVPKDLPKIMKVYFAQAGNTTFLSPDRARDLALGFLFPNGPERVTPTQYKFTDDQGGEILIDLNTGNFKFQRSETTPSAQLVKVPFISEQKLVAEFRSYLAGKVSLIGLGGRNKAIFDKKNPEESTIAKVSIWPGNIDEYQVMTPKYEESSIRAVITSFRDPAHKYKSLNFVYWPVDTATYATYYIRTAEQAFIDLKTGQGSVVLSPSNMSRASITSVYLAYYQQEEYTPYVQPIYVFEGQDFMAYVPAISQEYLAP